MVSKATGIGLLLTILGFGVTYLVMTKQYVFDDYRMTLVFLSFGILGVIILHYKVKRR